jgi:hypothetical protein
MLRFFLMTERKKDILFLAALLAVLVLFFSHILFTGKIIRAPDIINEFYWNVKGIADLKFWQLFNVNLSSAGWDSYVNSGFTNEGGAASLQFLFFRNLVFWLFPAPASVAWYIVLHLCFGAAGVYCYCRLIGVSRMAALLGGLIFAMAPENASLINAGHVMKIATISFAPWAFYFFEKGFQRKRLIWFLSTGFVLAFQFFQTHWQVAFYTCLAIGVYGVMRSVGIILKDRQEGKRGILRLIGLDLVVMLFFLSTVAISLAPLANWSKDTNRGVNSGANSVSTGGSSQPKGGLDREEAMSWSLPPEELGAFVIPGLFGLSRQEGGENPTNIMAYYWGRMRFTQTVSYMGLLPWLLLPLPLIFRRDRYTWLALAAVVVGILFSMGKYTPFYNFLFDYFPGINRFRVPKMIMFIPVMGLGVLAAIGLDILTDPEVRGTKAFGRYLMGVMLLPVALLLLLAAELIGRDYWIGQFYEMLVQPTRYEEGPQLVGQRWNNLIVETGITAGLAAFFAAAFGAFQRRWLTAGVLTGVLLVFFLADVGRINSKFLFLVDEPQKGKTIKTPVMEYLLSHGSNQYRVLPMSDDPMPYVANRIPVMFTSNPVQQQRWQNFLDALVLSSAMPDLVNLKYLIYGTAQYAQEKAQLGAKYIPVFQSPDSSQVVLENRNVLPKGWLVPAVVQINDAQQTLAIMADSGFDPRKIAIVESPAPFPLADPNSAAVLPSGSVAVTTYEGEHIAVSAIVPRNALLVLGEKYYKGWKATVDGKPVEIYPVDHILRGVYLPPGDHKVEFVFDPLPYKIGKWLTLVSFAFFVFMLGREMWVRRKGLGRGRD